jgi:hypothetical protein
MTRDIYPKIFVVRVLHSTYECLSLFPPAVAIQPQAQPESLATNQEPFRYNFAMRPTKPYTSGQSVVTNQS